MFSAVIQDTLPYKVFLTVSQSCLQPNVYLMIPACFLNWKCAMFLPPHFCNATHLALSHLLSYYLINSFTLHLSLDNTCPRRPCLNVMPPKQNVITYNSILSSVTAESRCLIRRSTYEVLMLVNLIHFHCFIDYFSYPTVHIQLR